jgi:hypothetical protein
MLLPAVVVLVGFAGDAQCAAGHCSVDSSDADAFAESTALESLQVIEMIEDSLTRLEAELAIAERRGNKEVQQATVAKITLRQNQLTRLGVVVRGDQGPCLWDAVCTYEDGSEYIGTVLGTTRKDGKIVGSAGGGNPSFGAKTCTWSEDAAQCADDYSGILKHGVGMFTHANGDVYSGSYVDDLRDGTGM